MREETRINLIEIGLTAIATVAVVVLLGFILFVAYKYFDGWYILAAITVEIALLVLIYHLYRWIRCGVSSSQSRLADYFSSFYFRFC